MAKTLLQLSKSSEDTWTIGDSLKGTSIMGSTGAGKTTSSGEKIAVSFLKEGWGGLVLCAKTDEAQLWRDYCARKDVNRTEDLIIFSKGSKHESGDYKGQEIVFNPIDYEMQRSGKGARETQNITNIFMSIYRMGNRISSEGDTKEERYWDTALKRCLNRVIELLKISKIDLTYSNMVGVLSTSGAVNELSFTDILNRLTPDQETSKEERKLSIESAESDLEQRSNFCLKCLVDAHFNVVMLDEDVTEERMQAYNLVRDYFVYDMPAMGSRTKSVVTESFMGLAEPFLSGLLFRHFSGKTNLFPEQTYTDKKIIVLDLSIKEYLDAGIIAQSVFKLLFQQAIERRNSKQFPIPVFLWCDEAQYFINTYDQVFLTTARSSRTATVFLSQNISNYFAVMGSGSDAKARVDSLMGNLCTKIFHANSDAETNEYASKLIGSAIGTLDNNSEQRGAFSLTGSYSEGKNSQYLPQVQPREFTILRTGGEGENNYIVDSIIQINGRKWANGNNFLKVPFKQDFSQQNL